MTLQCSLDTLVETFSLLEILLLTIYFARMFVEFNNWKQFSLEHAEWIEVSGHCSPEVWTRTETEDAANGITVWLNW